MTRFIVALAAMGILGCSAPKNYYYFDYVEYASPKATLPHENTRKDSVEAAPLSIEPQELLASVEATPVYAPVDAAENGVAPVASSPEASNADVSHTTATMTKREARKELKELIRSFRKSAAVNDVKAAAEKKDSRKDGFAIAGFVLSLVSLFALWPLAILGVIFSAIGLRSNKRGLAIAGLVIGIVALVLVLAGAAALSAA